jgi:hypothetical protein
MPDLVASGTPCISFCLHERKSHGELSSTIFLKIVQSLSLVLYKNIWSSIHLFTQQPGKGFGPVDKLERWVGDSYRNVHEITKKLTSLCRGLEIPLFDYYCAGYSLGGRDFVTAGQTNFLFLTESVSALVQPKPLIQWKP